MDPKDQLQNLRKRIDNIDEGIASLFNERMQTTDKIAKVKVNGNISVVDEKREQAVIKNALKHVEEDNKPETIMLMRTIMALSKLRQNLLHMNHDSLEIPSSSEKPSAPLKVGFQGIPGAWSEHGAVQLYPESETLPFDYFEDVFNAAVSGQIHYGVLPIENSQTGAIGEVYDLLKRYNCYISGQVWITVAQCLLAQKGASVGGIREVFSHPEGLSQCSRFLRDKNWDLTPVGNTAIAAEKIAGLDSARYAAIGSRRAAELYGLQVLSPDIMDNSGNKTRFISISAKPVHDETCDTTSITFSTAHRTGTLCAVLECFSLAGINLSRIESRPVSKNKYRFFADLDANILNQDHVRTLKTASAKCEYFEFLGCYKTAGEF